MVCIFIKQKCLAPTALQALDHWAQCTFALHVSWIEVSKSGDHALCCGHKGERIARHNQLRDHLHDMAAAAALNPTKENIFLLPGTDRRPADVLIPNWAGGLDAALDVTVVNPLQGALVKEAAVTPGHALEFRYGKKMDGAAEACRREGIVFLPLVVDGARLPRGRSRSWLRPRQGRGGRRKKRL